MCLSPGRKSMRWGTCLTEGEEGIGHVDCGASRKEEQQVKWGAAPENDNELGINWQSNRSSPDTDLSEQLGICLLI